MRARLSRLAATNPSSQEPGTARLCADLGFDMPTDAERSILFADIVDSTRLYARLGDEEARRILGEAVRRLSDVVEAHRGTVIKTIGDEVMCTFGDPNEAAAAARDMQGELEEYVASARLTVQLNAHIGLHHGGVIQDEGDVFGDAVNVAARLVSLAKPREILTTEATRARLRPEEHRRSHFTFETPLKGKHGQVKLYELAWEDFSLTTAALPPVDEGSAESPMRLRLRHGNVAFDVSMASSALSLGRQRHNDIVVEGRSVSRTHARILWRHHRFFLVDVSTNGTHVCEEGAEPVWVNRLEHELLRGGSIGLGEAVGESTETVLEYEVFKVPSQSSPTRMAGPG